MPLTNGFQTHGGYSQQRCTVVEVISLNTSPAEQHPQYTTYKRYPPSMTKQKQNTQAHAPFSNGCANLRRFQTSTEAASTLVTTDSNRASEHLEHIALPLHGARHATLPQCRQTRLPPRQNLACLRHKSPQLACITPIEIRHRRTLFFFCIAHVCQQTTSLRTISRRTQAKIDVSTISLTGAPEHCILLRKYVQGVVFRRVNKQQLLLYAITDRTWLNGSSLYEAVEESLKGGVSCLQLREKNLDAGRFLQEARQLKPLCQLYNVPFIINDNVDIALASDADGVHIGQSDGDVLEIRAHIGHDKILGVSASTVEEALEAERVGADYLGVGAVFPTNTKNDAESVSLPTLRDICNTVSVPVVAIGGITFDNVSLLTDSGICGIAVISAIYAQKDIQTAAERLKAKAEKCFGS